MTDEWTADRIRALTPAQKRYLGWVCVGEEAFNPNARVMRSLIDMGAVDHWEENHGILTIFRFNVPIPVHMAWCAWAAEGRKKPR